MYQLQMWSESRGDWVAWGRYSYETKDEARWALSIMRDTAPGLRWRIVTVE